MVCSIVLIVLLFVPLLHTRVCYFICIGRKMKQGCLFLYI